MASADATAQARVRETFAQFVPAEAKKPEPQVQRKRKIAKIRPAPPMQFGSSRKCGLRSSRISASSAVRDWNHLVKRRRLI